MKQILILIIIVFVSLPIQIFAKMPINTDFCDKIFSASFEMQVDGTFPECRARFKFLVNQINTSFNHK